MLSSGEFKDRIASRILQSLEKVEKGKDILSDRRVLNMPLAETLREACTAGWSGLIRVIDDTEHVGSIVLRDGNVAWVTSKYQKEDFGGLLKRLDIVSNDILRRFRKKYQSPGKLKKLMKMIEEESQVSHEELRDHFLHHSRNVLFQIFSKPGLQASSLPGRLEVDPENTFRWDEIFIETSRNGALSVRPSATSDSKETNGTVKQIPGKVQSGNQSEKADDSSEADKNILEQFVEINGYLASLIISSKGGILVVHSQDDQAPVHEVGRAAATLLSAQRSVEAPLGLGDAEFTLVEGTEGSCVLHWIDEARKYAIAALLDKTGRPGVLKHKIVQALGDLRAYVDENR